MLCYIFAINQDVNRWQLLHCAFRLGAQTSAVSIQEQASLLFGYRSFLFNTNH